MNESFCLLDFSDIDDIFKSSEIKVMFTEMLSAFTENYKNNPKFRAGLWDGKKKFYKIINTDLLFPKGMTAYLKRKIETTYPDIEFVIETNTFYEQISEQEFDDHIKNLEMPFQPYDYQRASALESINTGRMTIGAATGSGKSCIIYLIMSFMKSKGIRTVLIVPSVSLVEQMHSDFISYGLKDPESVHKISAGLPKHFNEMLTISTWQSLYNSPELFEGVECILVDEVHTARSDVFNEIILPSAINCKYRIGLTGTMPKNYADKISILGSLGPHKKFVNAQGLIDRGLATPVEIKMLFLNYSDIDKEDFSSQKKVFKGNSQKMYAQEIKYIESHIVRNELISKYAKKISESGNTLVMFNNIEHGKFLLRNFLKYKFNLNDVFFLEKITPKSLSEIPESVEKIFVNNELSDKQQKTILKTGLKLESFDCLSRYNIFLIYGGVDKDDREDIRVLLEELEEATVFASYGTTSTGINIKKIHNILLTSSSKSGIRINQTIGRGMRLHESKNVLKIYDFIDDFSKKTKTGNVIASSRNSVLNHSEERMSMYLENGYPIKEIEIFVK
jgi:superfamily II DNA or RNA helicase